MPCVSQAMGELLASGARPALLMEQFDRERQADIDKAMSRPGASADDVIEASSAQGTGWAWPLYRPFIALALPIPAAAGRGQRVTCRRASGFAGRSWRPPASMRRCRIACRLPTRPNAILASHCAMLNETQARRMATAQVARDQFMAQLLNQFSARGAVLLAGNGHVRNDVGVPAWLTHRPCASAVWESACWKAVKRAPKPTTVVVTTAAPPSAA